MKEIKIDKLIRSKRKTVSLTITQDARVVVRAPLKTPLDYIRKILQKKSSWIRKKQKVSREWWKKYRPKAIVNGETFLFLGKKYQLKIIRAGNDVELAGSLNIPQDLLPHAGDAIIDWYKRQALITITERVDRYSRLTGLKYKSIRISSASRRLASCGCRGTLNFSWRIILAPLEIIDYIVVHEMSHLEHMNHSKKFWDKVKSIMPGYAERKKWLKDNGHLVHIRF